MATIKDVARQAGVSVATVSRAFNDSAVVSEHVLARVRRVASRLNYWPNGAARSLITNRTHAIGVLLPDLFGEFFSEVIRGIDHAARESGLHLLLSSSHADTEELVAALRAMRGRIDGLIVMAPDVDAPKALECAHPDIPLVLIDPGLGVSGYDSISIANQDGARALVEHLLDLGHRRIATITGPRRNIDAEQRLAGYRLALKRRRVERDPELEIAGDFSEPSGYEAVDRLLALKRRPTAVFVANDYMAIGVLGALSDAGLRVPQDMAVGGFDDIAMSRYLNPPLTTVRVDAYGLGQRAAARLIRAARTSPAPARTREVLPTTLVIRGSCGAAGGERSRPGVTRSRAR
ncbi:MAG TPA: LacI family DNA-binding transcriptional regulator [Candidatus Eisenbacteria bacterium]|jgi:LacI family transcriptional regulator